MDGYGGGGLCVHPPAEHAAAREDQPVDLGCFEDRDFQIALERCACDGLPFHGWIVG